jgi:hypothetical protein
VVLQLRPDFFTLPPDSTTPFWWWEPMRRASVYDGRNPVSSQHAQLRDDRETTSPSRGPQLEKRLEESPCAPQSRDFSKRCLELPAHCMAAETIRLCRRSSGAAAVVITSEDVIEKKGLEADWINGMGARANTVFMGDRMGPKAQTDMADGDKLRLLKKLVADLSLDPEMLKAVIAKNRWGS